MPLGRLIVSLSKVKGFENIGQKVLDDLGKMASRLELKSQDVLFREGDLGGDIYLLSTGSVEASKLDQLGQKASLRTLKGGELIGLTSFFTRGRRSATLVCCEDAELWRFDANALREYLFEKSDDSGKERLSSALFVHMSQKIRAKNLQALGLLKSEDKVNIAFFDSHDYIKEAFDTLAPKEWQIKYIDSHLSAETAVLAHGSDVVCSFVNDHVDEEIASVLSQFGVKGIALRCAGFNQVDIKACHRHGIKVARVPAYSPHAVAEHGTALLLCLNRKLHMAYSRIKQSNFALDGLVGFDLHGKTVGVIGTGKIGACFARQMLGFGCRVLAYDVKPSDELAEHESLSYVGLDELLGKSDIISLHAPLVPETKHLINDASIEKMKDGVYIINTSRGGLIDSQALIRALKSRKIGAAALDVYEEEADYFFEDHSDEIVSDDVLARLMTFNNVLITSHQAFLTRDALHNIASVTVDNIKSFLEDEKTDNWL